MARWIKIKKFLEKIQFSKSIVQCIIKAAEEGDIFEYNRADASRESGTFEITPIYPVERYVTIGEDKVLFGDGSHIMLVIKNWK